MTRIYVSILRTLITGYWWRPNMRWFDSNYREGILLDWMMVMVMMVDTAVNFLGTRISWWILGASRFLVSTWSKQSRFLILL